MLKMIIFDMDGVLLDSESRHFPILRDMMKKRGFPYTVEHLHRYCGVPEEKMWPQLLRKAGLNDENPEKLQQEHWQLYNKDIQENGLPRFPGTREFLERLQKEGLQLAVASASPVQVILENLRGLGIDHCFSCIASAQECGNGKPEPDVFLLAANKLNIAPEDCMVVEDSANGMIAARRAGMRWIGFCGAQVKPDMHLAVFTFSDYRTITPEQFQQWYNQFPAFGSDMESITQEEKIVKNVWNESCILAPSLICLDMCNLEEQVHILERSGIKMLHVDILDGHFSPSMPLGLDTVRQLRAKTDLQFDCHVMVTEPDYFVDELLDIGVDQIVFHAETQPHIDGMLNRIHAKGVRAGVALKPATPLSELEYVLEKCDTVLLMLINPGYAFVKGEQQVAYAQRKIKELRAMIDQRGLNTKIEVDGRISSQNIQQYGAKDVDIFVTGSTCIDRADMENSFMRLNELRASVIGGK